MESAFITFPNTERVLREYIERVRAAYRENLRGSGHYTMDASTLLNNIDVEVVNDTAGSIRASLRLADYWKYIEYGTKPHWPPAGALLDWIRLKPILPKPDGNGRIPTPEQIDYLIRRRIAGLAPDGHGGYKPGGTTGTHDLEKAVDAINEHYLEAISDAVAQDIDQFTAAQIWLLAGSGK